MLYHILSHIQFGNPHQLQKYIDNRNGDKMVGLKSITYWIGWYNIKETQYISVNDKVKEIEPGLYSFNDLQEKIDEAGVKIYVSKNSGIATLLVMENTVVFVSSELMKILGFDIKDQKLSVLTGYPSIPGLSFAPESIQKRYKAETPIDFATPKELRVCLKELNTEQNYFNGAPSTILEILPAPEEGYGNVVSTRFEIPSFKKLENGCITELDVCIRDENNMFLKNNGHNITIELCIK